MFYVNLINTFHGKHNIVKTRKKQKLVDYLVVDALHRPNLNDSTSWRQKSPFPSNSTSKILSYAKGIVTRVQDESINSLFADPRKEQLQEIATNLDEAEMSATEQALNRNLAIASASLVSAIVGTLVYPPLWFLSPLGLCWIASVLYYDAYQAFKERKRRATATLYIVYITVAIVTGYYFASALGASFYLLSKKLLSKTEENSRQSLIDVFHHQSHIAWLVSEGVGGENVETEVLVETLESGDVIVVNAGEVIPVDGIVIHGTGRADQRALTGESQPAEKEVGSSVFASTLVLSGKIFIEVENAGQDTVAAQIGNILNQTTDFKSSIQTWGEEIGNTSSRALLILAGLSLPLFGVATALTVLNASLGLYMVVLGPLSMLSFLNLASKKGVLIKDGRSLQLLTDVDMVVFDKTGTLTQDEPHVGQVHTCPEYDEDTILAYAAAAEYKQTHPIAKAIRRQAMLQNLTLPEVSDVHCEIGYGLKVQIAAVEPRLASLSSTDEGQNLQLVRVGSRRFMEMEDIVISSQMIQHHQASHELGHSLVYVAVDDTLAGVIELHATVRPETKQVIQALRQRGLDMAIISGDHEKPTRQLAQTLGIDQYFAETLPENKADIIGKLQQEGRSVCFMGDGINDSIALKKANVSISLRGASSAATDAAQVVLMQQDLNQLLHLLDIAHHFKTNMKVNLAVTLLPGMMTLFGAFFLGFGVIHSVVLNATGVVSGASNAILPWLREQKRQNDK